jgi:hypothetical protein
MATLNERLLTVLRARRDEYVRLIEVLVAEGQGPQAELYGPAEASQLIDGLLALLAEALEGTGTEVRSFFVQTAIPSMVAHDSGPAEIIAGSVRHCVLMVTDAVRHLPEEDRAAATQWLAKFFGGYVADIAIAATRPTAS